MIKMKDCTCYYWVNNSSKEFIIKEKGTGYCILVRTFQIQDISKINGEKLSCDDCWTLELQDPNFLRAVYDNEVYWIYKDYLDVDDFIQQEGMII